MLDLRVFFLLLKTYMRLSMSHWHSLPTFLWLIGTFSESSIKPCRNSSTNSLQVAILLLSWGCLKQIEERSMVALLLQVTDF